MARSDLLISLVRAATNGDRTMLRTTVETIAAEERAQQHDALADRLTRALNAQGSQVAHSTQVAHGSPKVQLGRELLNQITPRKTLGDLVLTSEVRQQCMELVEEQLRADLLRSHGLEPRHRVLLSGPPGNGKTALAEAVAEALALPFYSVRYDGLIASYLGETAQRLARLFEYVRTIPCVVLFDEFDAIGKERGDEHETGEIKRVVSNFLLQVDALPSYVVVVAATNHPELLDKAAWRRFQLRLTMPAPTAEQLVEFFSKVFHAAQIQTDTKKLVQRLGLMSYAEAMDFVLDVQRKNVLALGELVPSSLIEDKVKLWSKRVGAAPNAERSRQAVAKIRPARKRPKSARRTK
ncbi:AAA family ATPase [Bradyrhizobium ottawaense]|uniref:AAA family ATPase n=1 Tax=Bradyrhizobium ottawaense TaxID=931866 RepID=UPI0030F41D3E